MAFFSDFIKKVKGESITVGIDVGHHSIKVVKVSHSQKSRKLIDYGIAELPYGTIVDGVVQNSEVLTNILLNLLGLIGGVDSNTDVVLSLAWSNGVLADIVKMRTQPGMTDEELILSEAGRRAPFDDPDITLDYKILNRSEETNDINVLLVAVKNDVLNRWVIFFKDAGINPSVIDADTFGLHNAYYYKKKRDALKEAFSASDDYLDSLKEESVAILNIGQVKSNITFINNGVYHSTRDIPRSSIEGFARKVSRSLGIRQEKAVQIIKGEEVEGITKENIEEAYRDAFDDLAMDTQQTFAYYQSTGGGSGLNLLLCGGGSSLPGLLEAFREKLEITVEYLDLCNSIEVDEMKFHEGISAEVSSQLSVAIGMALRKV